MTPTQKARTQDLQTYPFVMIPKAFFTRFKPSKVAILAYLSLKYFASNRTGTTEFTSIPTMAGLVDLSERGFQMAVAELVKKGAVRVKHRTRKTSSGQRTSLPNLYEIVDLQMPVSEDAI